MTRPPRGTPAAAFDELRAQAAALRDALLEPVLRLVDRFVQSVPCPCGDDHREAQPGSRDVPAGDVHGQVLADVRADWLNDDGREPWER
jgi:hypothetical protein